MLVLPPIAYGLNMHHIDFPGTIHIEPEVFIYQSPEGISWRPGEVNLHRIPIGRHTL